MKFKSSFTRSGRFSVENQGDLGIKAFTRQQQDILRFLEIERRQHKEQGNEYLAGLKGVFENENKNAQILNKLRGELWKTKFDAFDVKAKRDVEALKGIAKEYGLQAEYWGDFTKSGYKAFAGLYDATVNLGQSIQAKNWEQNFEESGGLANLIEFNEQANIKVDHDIGIEVEGLINSKDPEAKDLAHYLTGKQWFANPKIAAKFKAIIDKNKDEVYQSMRNELIQTVEEHNAKVGQLESEGKLTYTIDETTGDKIPNEKYLSYRELLPEFAEGYAKAMLGKLGVSDKTKDARSVIAMFKRQAGLEGINLDNKVKAEKALKIHKDNLETLQGSSLDFTVEGNKEKFENSVRNAINSGRLLWGEKDGKYFRINLSSPEGINALMETLAENPDTEFELLQAIRSVQLPATPAGHPAQTLGERMAYTGTEHEVNLKWAQTQREKSQISNEQRGREDEENYKTLYDKYNNPNLRSELYDDFGDKSVLKKEVVQELVDDYWKAKAKGWNKTADYLSEILFMKDMSNITVVQVNNLHRYAAEGDFKAFNTIFYNLSSANQIKFQHLQKSLEGITAIDLKQSDTALDRALTKSAGGIGALKTISKTKDDILPIAKAQRQNLYVSMVEDRDTNENSEYKGKTNKELFNLAEQEIVKNINDQVGIYELQTPRDSVNSAGTHFKHVLPSIDPTKDFNQSQMKEVLRNINSLENLEDSLAKKEYSFEGEGDSRYNGAKPLSNSTIVALIKDVENGGDLTIPENIKIITAHLQSKGENVTVSDVANAFLKASGSATYISKSPKEINNDITNPNVNKGEIDNSGSNQKQICKNLHNRYVEKNNKLPISNYRLLDLELGRAGDTKDGSNDDIEKAFTKAGLKVNIDFKLDTVKRPFTFDFDPNNRNMTVIRPISNEGAKVLFREYKKMSLKIKAKHRKVENHDGKYVDMMSCEFMLQK